MMWEPRHSRLMFSTCLWPLGAKAGVYFVASAALAGPEGGVVSAGNAAISQQGPHTQITQQSDRAVIDWSSFDVRAGESVHFVQPSAASIVLNRIHDAKPSQIDGALSANGQVILSNSNGITFGASATVDISGLVATTADIDNTRFMQDTTLTFNRAGKTDGTIINHGNITAKEAGLVALVAPGVHNSGVIAATAGKVQLAGGETMTLDLYGDGLLSVAAPQLEGTVVVDQQGVVSANGGQVLLTAAQASETVDSLINMGGIIEAQSLGLQKSEVAVFAPGRNAVKNNVAAIKGTTSGTSLVTVSGIIDASGINAGEMGGNITVTGDHVGILDGALIAASGDAGGGDIQIGGDYLGTGTTPTAIETYIAPYTLIYNDALRHGDGGRTIVWSDGDTYFYGNIYGRGGTVSGDGGFAETSGKQYLDARGFVDLTAPHGTKGTYLLDPTDITIYGNVDPNFVSTDTTVDLSNGNVLWLDASDTSTVTLTYSADELGGATADGVSGSNTITTSADVSDWLRVGSRIRLGGAGSVTTVDTLGTDTYTITNIAGTTITVAETLTGNYTTQTLNRGLVSNWADKSGATNHATQTTAEDRPLFSENGDIGGNAIFTDGINDGMFINDLDDDLIIRQGVNSGLYVSTVWHSNGGGNTDWNGNATVGGQAIGILGKQGVTNHTGAKSFAVGSSNSGNDLFLRVNTETTGGAGNSLNVSGGFKPTYYNTNSILNYALSSDGIDQFTLTEYIQSQQVASQTLTTTNVLDQDYQSGGNFVFGARHLGNDAHAPAQYSEMLAYNRELGTSEKNLLSQYQSTKWGITLDPLAGAGTEVAEATASIQKGDASDGFSEFTTRYLEKLSATADIVLHTSNDITLDLQGDTMAFTTAGRSLTLNANNQIRTASTGTITTNDGAINFNGTNGIILDHALTLDSGTATTSFNATNAPITINAALALDGTTTMDAGSGTITTGAAGIITMGANRDLTFEADDLAIGAAVNAGANSLLNVRNNTVGVDTFIGTTGAGQSLDGTEIELMDTGWSRFNFGTWATNRGDEVTVGNLDLDSDVTITTQQEDINITGNVELNGHNLTLNTYGIKNISGSVTSAGGTLSLAAGGWNLNTVGSAGTTITAASLDNIVDGWGLISIGSTGTRLELSEYNNWRDPVRFRGGSLAALPANGYTTILGSQMAAAGSDASFEFEGPVTLTDNITINSDDGDVDFAMVIDGDGVMGRSLTVDAGAGSFIYGDDIGGTTPLENVSLRADTIAFTNNITATDTLSIASGTATTMDVGTAGAGALQITDANLANLSATNYAFGDTNSGDLVFDSTFDFTGGNLSLYGVSVDLQSNTNAGVNMLLVDASTGSIDSNGNTLTADTLNLDAAGSITADVNVTTALDIGNNSNDAKLTGLFQGGATQTEANLVTGGPGNNPAYTLEGFTIRYAPSGGGGPTAGAPDEDGNIVSQPNPIISAAPIEMPELTSPSSGSVPSPVSVDSASENVSRINESETLQTISTTNANDIEPVEYNATGGNGDGSISYNQLYTFTKELRKRLGI